MIDWSKIVEKINRSTYNDELYLSASSISGGDINSAYELRTNNKKRYFVKLNQPSLIDMFSAEFEALIELGQCDAIGSPVPICYGATANNSFIVMEYLSLQSNGNHFKFGQSLAKMHQNLQPQHGWKMDNTIGSTPQSNSLHDNWAAFYKSERLIPQFECLYKKGYKDQLKKQADYLLAGLDDFFQDYQPMASLLHGDLWSGNYAFNKSGNGVIFDPALHYGDRETDIAMTELFGGFSNNFYLGYQETFPFADSNGHDATQCYSLGYKKRKPMYNLYHILNHANLFGGSYLNQALSLMKQLNQ